MNKNILKNDVFKNPILEVNNLSISFQIEDISYKVIRNAFFKLFENEILGIVGESGSGKTVLTQSIVKLHSSSAIKYIHGEIIYNNNVDLLKKSSKELIDYRGSEIAYIFQDPFASLNPTMKIGKQIIEGIKDKNEKNKSYAISLLKEVGIENAEKKYNHYPHQLSGGQRQRVMIAIAIAMNPKILIADEPTTALDVSIQWQILDLIKNITKKRKTSVIFISHDLKIVSNLADRILVMYGGEIIEKGKRDQIICSPKHPYTKLLLKSVPKIKSKEKKLSYIKGTLPDLSQIDKGCLFRERCPYFEEKCLSKINIFNKDEFDHVAKCHLNFCKKEN